MEEQINQENQMSEKQFQVQPIDESKKSKWWIWVIAILALIVLSVGIYYVFFGGEIVSITNTGSSTSSGSIPQPPALPN